MAMAKNPYVLGKANPYTLTPSKSPYSAHDAQSPRSPYRPYSPNPDSPRAAQKPQESTRSSPNSLSPPRIRYEGASTPRNNSLSPPRTTYGSASPRTPSTPTAPTKRRPSPQGHDTFQQNPYTLSPPATASHGDLNFPQSLVRDVKLHDLPYPIDIKLKLPNIPGQDDHKPEKDNPVYRELIHAHSAFYLSDARAAPSKASKKATSDLAAARRAFPVVRDQNVLLAMASWYALLCATDDTIETMPPALARLALSESIMVLQRTEDTYDWRDAFHAPAAFGGREEEQVPGFAKLSIDQVRKVLPRDVYARLVESIIDVWLAMNLETTFKETGGVDEDTYLQTRARTIGLRPFFILLEYSCDPDASFSDTLLEDIKTNVTVAVGLQNDILGLRHDIRERESNNYVMVSSQNSGRDFAYSLEKAVVVHNNAVSEAVASWRKFGDAAAASGKGERGREFVGGVVGFVGRHFGWVGGEMR